MPISLESHPRRNQQSPSYQCQWLRQRKLPRDQAIQFPRASMASPMYSRRQILTTHSLRWTIGSRSPCHASTGQRISLIGDQALARPRTSLWDDCQGISSRLLRQRLVQMESLFHLQSQRSSESHSCLNSRWISSLWPRTAQTHWDSNRCRRSNPWETT